jgi:purine-binding chemotaxis protein CheW
MKVEVFMERQLVVFDLGGEHFGVDIVAVDGIVDMMEITRVPQSPDFVEGVTNLRGSILPVIDLRKRLKLPVLDRTKETRIVVVNMDGLKVGMVVDAVSEVLTISDDVIEPPPPSITSVDTAFITGIAKVAPRLIILLDLVKVLSIEEKAALKAI